MKYQELNEILCKAAKEKRVVEAFVTFTPDSFEDTYTQLERTGPEDGDVNWKIIPIYMDGSDVVVFEEA